MPHRLNPQSVRNANRNELDYFIREGTLGDTAYDLAMAELRRRRAHLRLVIGGGALLLIGAVAIGIAIASMVRMALAIA